MIKIMTQNSGELLYHIFWATISLVVVNFGLIGVDWSDALPLSRGIFVMACGFIFFINLTLSFNKFFLNTLIGQKFLRKYKLRISDVLDLTAR